LSANAGTRERRVTATQMLEEARMSEAAMIIPSPVGDLRLVARGDALVALGWARADETAGDGGATYHPVLAEARRQLDAYFAGQRRAFDLPLAAAGTDFQRRVWAALLTIPYGETRSYGDIARVIGRPSASRAVGAANGRNPIAIVVPCHRVIGGNGSLTGFGGGMTNKKLLLDLEQAPRLI
jgi:methylated-DNA-[protein]-cysteine S-methyltransferase